MKRTKVSIDKESLKNRDFSNSVKESEEYENREESKSKFEYIVKILGYMYSEEYLVSN